MQARDVDLVELAADAKVTPWEAITMVVEVHAVPNSQQRVAQLRVSDVKGATEQRQVQATRCEDLLSAVAWVLVALAKEHHTQETSELRSPEVPEVLRQAKASTINAPTEGGVRAVVPSFSLQGHVLPEEVHHARLSLGAAVAVSTLFVPEAAVGLVAFIEYRPWGKLLPMFRLSATELATAPVQGALGVGVTIRRVAARLTSSMRMRDLPLGIMGGIEVGTLTAHGSGLQTAREDTAGWVAALLGGRGEIPLIRKRLSLDIAAFGAYSPYTYGFQSHSGASVLESGHWDLRVECGLAAHF
jgi:hypothetical protein